MNKEKIDSQSKGEKKLVECADIQVLLFDYMSRELGEGRAAIVREHLRKCRACQVLARDIQATMDLLQTASKAGSTQKERLTESRRNKIIWSFTHPLLCWMHKNILLVSIFGAALLFVAVWFFSRFMIESRFAPLKGDPVTVMIIDHGKTNVVQGTNSVQNGTSEK